MGELTEGSKVVYSNVALDNLGGTTKIRAENRCGVITEIYDTAYKVQWGDDSSGMIRKDYVKEDSSRKLVINLDSFEGMNLIGLFKFIVNHPSYRMTELDVELIKYFLKQI